MHDGGGGGGGFTGGSGLSGDHHGGHTTGGHSGSGHSGSGHGSSGAGGFDPSGQRAPYRDSLDPLGPMSMPKIVGRVVDRARRGQQGPSIIAARIFVMSVLALIIVFGILFIIHGN
jgi:hypothetical protein